MVMSASQRHDNDRYEGDTKVKSENSEGMWCAKGRTFYKS